MIDIYWTRRLSHHSQLAQNQNKTYLRTLCAFVTTGWQNWITKPSKAVQKYDTFSLDCVSWTYGCNKLLTQLLDIGNINKKQYAMWFTVISKSSKIHMKNETHVQKILSKIHVKIKCREIHLENICVFFFNKINFVCRCFTK